MNKLNLIIDIIDKAKKLGATDADAVIINSLSIDAEVRLSNVVSIERSENIALGIRVLINGQQAMVSTSDLNKKSIDEVLHRAISMAKVTPSNPHAFLATQEQLADKIMDLNLYDNNEPTAENLIERAKETESFALSDNLVTNSNGAQASYAASKLYFAASNGFAQSYSTSGSSLSVSVIAGKDENMQRDYAYSSAIFTKDLKTPEEIGKEAAKRAVDKLLPKKLATSEMAVIFEPRTARRLLAAFASSINGSAISRGTSFLVNTIGQQIFNNNINIIDDPFIMKAFASRPFDAEGLLGKKRNIIEQGILQHYFLDLQTASKLKMQSTGHATRGIATAPVPSCSNLYIESGTVSLQEMIKSIKKGLLITEIFGHGANIITGDYSQGASGFYIENGEITYPVSEITIASNLKSMFSQVIPADDLKFEASINSPSLLIEKMTIAGV